MHPGRGHGAAAGVAVGVEQVVEPAEPADLARAAEAPGRGAEPSDVLGRVAGVGQLPVEHAAQALGPDQEVAAAEVAVDGDPGAGLGSVRGQPACPELERGTHLAQGIEQGQGIAQRVGPGQAVDAVGVDGMDGGQGAPALCGERAAGGRPLAVAQDLAGDGLAVEPLDHQPGRADVVVLAQGDDPGHRDAAGAGRLEQVALGPALALGRAAAPLDLEDERPPAVGHLELERAGHPRGAPREPAQAVHAAAQATPERARQVVAASRVGHRCAYSTGTTGLPAPSSWCRYSQMPYPVRVPPSASS